MEDRRTLFINSKDRVTGNFNDFIVQSTITDTFFTLQPNERLFIIPERFSVLNDFNNVNGYNNSFTFIIDNFVGGETAYTITADIGVYTSYTFQIEIQSKINALLTGQSIPVSLVITFDDNAEKYIYTFTSTNPTYFDDNEIKFSFDDIETSLAIFMGFSDGEYIASSSAGDTSVFNSYQAVNMVFQPEINVYCNLVSNNYETTNDGTKASQLLLSVNQGAKGDFITFENPSGIFKNNCNSPFSSIHIRYLDNERRPILFQSNSRLSLTFIKIKEENTEKRMLEILEKMEAMNRLSLLTKQFNITR